MKDITYYFGDSPRNSENTSVATKEVSMERAKIDDAAVVEETRGKRKRGRVKIKISRKSSEGTVCDIIENSTDLVDKTPSPYPKPKRRQTASVDDTPKRSTSKAKESDKKASELQTDKRNETNVNSDSKNQLNGLTPKDTDDSVTNANTKQTNQSDTAKVENETKKKEKKVSAKKEKEKLKQQTEKLIELADKKGYTKRKLLEEKEDEKIAKRLEKRKQMFTLNKTPEVFPQGDENTPKNTDSTNVKRPGSLLNYFSKATPEQIEKEKLMKSKFTVKAEIHAPKNLSTSTTPVSNKKKKDSPKKRNKSTSKLKEEFDEICLIETETLVLSPKNEKLLKSPMLQNKPKWSLKIQLQSNNNIKSMSDELDEDVYTPTASKKSQNENMKCSDKIPKILMPIKNKKDDINPSLNNNISKNKKEEKNNIKSDNEEKLKTEKIKTGVNKKLSSSTTSEQLHIKEDTNSKKEKVDDECQVIKENGLKRKSDEKLECIVENVISKKEVSDDECQIVGENRLKRKSKEKLAPLFTKKLKPNPEVIAARRLFLQSDVLENDSTTENRKPMVVGPIVLPFPKISHINQLSPDKNTTVKSCSFSLKKTENIDSFNLSQMKTLSKANDIPIILENIYECIKLDTEAALSEIETYYSDVHTLWKSISRLLKSPESPKRTPKTRRKTSQKKNLKKANENLNNELLNSPWTDKYRPMSSAEVVGNEEAAIKLKSWLDTWKSSKNNEEYSSGDEFYTSDCSMSSNIENNHAAVLIGPHGSGKTACVYAVAQELGYKVLEVNASSKRPGKKILKDFEEATKSHRVKKSNLKDVFVPVSKKTEETGKISQNSLILMEDVDLIFEEDEGFVSATYQLASNTKRPIVMTLRGTCSHLFKMAPQQFRIKFQPVTGKKVLALFQLITLAETGCKLSENCIETLCQSGDLRKGLLQLQYLLLSGKECISSLSLSANKSSWKDMRTYIYKPAIKADKSKTKKKKRTTDDNVLDNLSNSLEHFTLISTLINIEDPSSHSHNLNFEPSISLVENTSSYSSLENTSLEIGNWLNEFISKSESRDLKKTNNQMSTNNSQLSIQKQVNIDVDTALSQIPSNTLDRRALAVDYLSSIRTICRAEESRNQLNSKRGNRFFHYLQGSKLSNVAARSGNILSAACKMLQEKSTET